MNKLEIDSCTYVKSYSKVSVEKYKANFLVKTANYLMSIEKIIFFTDFLKF